ncbi:unnamed protein product, partial [marine sediment metagenome]
DPTFAGAWNNKGTAFAELGDFDKAINYYERAIEIDPTCASAWNNKGLAFSELGDFDKKIKCYEKAIEIDPTCADAYGNLGVVFIHLHKFNEALFKFRKAREQFIKRDSDLFVNDIEKLNKYELWTKNILELMNQLEPLDTQ